MMTPRDVTNQQLDAAAVAYLEHEKRVSTWSMQQAIAAAVNEILKDNVIVPRSTFKRWMYAADECRSLLVHNKMSEFLDSNEPPAQSDNQIDPEWAKAIHYPEHWDTAAYPTLKHAVHEIVTSAGCAECEGMQDRQR